MKAQTETGQYITYSPQETIQLGRKIGSKLKPMSVIAFYGHLGTGKTHLVKGIAKGLHIKKAITSPTFTLINEYSAEIPLYHFDLYRIKTVEQAYSLGIEEYFYKSGVVVIEWAEKVKAFLPEQAIDIVIEFLDIKTRKIVIKGLKI